MIVMNNNDDNENKDKDHSTPHPPAKQMVSRDSILISAHLIMLLMDEEDSGRERRLKCLITVITRGRRRGRGGGEGEKKKTKMEMIKAVIGET